MTSESTLVSRRAALRATIGASAGTMLLSGCSSGKAEEPEVSANEDLMREHGILRRILIVYRETAPVLRGAPAGLDVAALAEAADLFRTFGEDYHERRLEEQHIFPTVAKAGGEGAALVPTLLAQHDRGREITAFVRERCARGKIATGDAEPLARALESFARMYEAHTAYEDTIIFQAWKRTMSAKQLHETAEQFEDIEHDQFKGDGFDLAIDRIARIEQRLGLHDLGRFTAAPPARAG
jgi:hemerythrin-like domain-containing protein